MLARQGAAEAVLVADTIKGLSAAARARLFQPFVQVRDAKPGDRAQDWDSTSRAPSWTGTAAR